MRGTHAIRISNRRLDYRFEVRRNITIVRGDSGSGKTTLYEMVADYTRLGQSSGVQISCDKECVALVDMDWKAQLGRTRDAIVFLDEGTSYVKTTEFASAVRETDNYYVIITREALYALPYSVNEVYRIRSSGRYHWFERTYLSDERHAYGVALDDGAHAYSAVLAEDSNSGFQFMEHRFSGSEIVCCAAGGNASVYGWLLENPDEHVFVLADGAAFGAEATRVLMYQGEHPDRVTVCLPESFEWLLLASGVVKRDEVSAVLADPGAYIESREYFSWERFFVALIREATRGTAFAYSKARIAEAYTVPANADMVMRLISKGNVC